MLETRNLVISSNFSLLMFSSPRLILGYAIGYLATLQALQGSYSGLG
jgi:hypothetical protein